MIAHTVPVLNLEGVPELAAQVRIHVLDLKLTFYRRNALPLGKKLHRRYPWLILTCG
jgi:hypothetical protein